MASTNLQIPEIQANQDQKEVTANQAVDRLDKAMNTVTPIAGVSGDFDLTATQSRESGIVILQGTPGAAFNVDFPDANDRRLAFFNDTDAVATVRSSAETGDTVDVPIGEGVMVHYDGADVRAVGGGGGGGGGGADVEQVEHFVIGTVPADTVVYRKLAVREFTVDASFAGSRGHAGTPASGAAPSFDVLRNDVVVGTMDFADGAAEATFTTIPDRALAVTFDGTDGATTAVDFGASGHTLTFISTAQIDTAQSQFGGASLLLDGNSDAVSAPDSADWFFGTGEFTVHGWVRFASLSGLQEIVSQYKSQGGNRGWIFRYDGGADTLNFISSSTGSNFNTNVITGALGLAINTWYHVAVDRDAAGDVRIYLDGAVQTTTAMSSNINDAATDLLIGAIRNDSGNLTDFFNGHIDEVEIIKGHALWGAAFTPPELGVEKDYRTWPVGTRLSVLAPATADLGSMADLTLSLSVDRV